MALNVDILKDLITHNKAKSSLNAYKWQKAMEKEFNKLKDQNTQTLIKLLLKRKALKRQQIYKTKRGLSSVIQRYKAYYMVKRYL